jgi:hypothetical protein
MPLSSNDIRETTILPADIAAGKFTDWISCDDNFTIRIVSSGGAYTGIIRVQRRNNENDPNVGTIEVYAADAEEVGIVNTVKGMQYRIGAAAGDLTAVPGSIYVAVIK